ncbi:MAG: DUF4251 domain-containing protein [Rikenellaceae bacterium]
MKMKSLAITALICCAVALSLTVIAKRQNTTSSPQSEPREIREQRRAERQAATERAVDSLVLSHTFQFSPQSMQQELSGAMQMLSNPNFEVGIWDNSADIFIPYIKGMTPPYRHVMLNYTITDLSNYLTEQTDNGWQVSFTTSLYSANTYTFLFEISPRYGTATLTIKSPWYESVQYVGTISKFY